MMSRNTIKAKVLLHGCLLVLWTLTAFVSTDNTHFKVDPGSDRIKVTCPSGYTFNESDNQSPEHKIPYRDGNTGKYTCYQKHENGMNIFVKFRTCDNCVELDVGSVTGMIIGDIVATVVIGVAVYLIASHANQPGSVTSNKTTLDRQHEVPSERNYRPNDTYQRLRKTGQKDTYDELKPRR